MDLSFNLAPSYRDLKDPSTRQNFEDTVEQKRVIDLIACHTKPWTLLPEWCILALLTILRLDTMKSP